MKTTSILIIAALTASGYSQQFVHDFWHNYSAHNPSPQTQSWVAGYTLYPSAEAENKSYYAVIQAIDANGWLRPQSATRYIPQGKNLKFSVTTITSMPITDTRARVYEAGINGALVQTVGGEYVTSPTRPAHWYGLYGWEQITTPLQISQHYGGLWYPPYGYDPLTVLAVLVDDSVPEALTPVTVNWNGQQLFVSGSLVNLDPDQHIYGILITDGRGIVISQKSFAARDTYVFDSTRSILNRCDTAPYTLEALTADGWHTVGIYNRSGAGCLVASSECGYECGNPHDEIDDGGILICWDCFDDFY